MKNLGRISRQTKSNGDAHPVLITGGSGFIGTNMAHRLMQSGRPVLILDNLSRPGVEQNLRWLRDQYGPLIQVAYGDMRNSSAVRSAVREVSHVFHFAAQVAVTTSVTNPMNDFHVNTLGTLNLLEALRTRTHPPSLVYTSTNKVYGSLDDLEVVEKDGSYEPACDRIRENGIGEDRPLDFHSPYGCSKGAADQYVLDYARTYSIPAAVFRMSCIYGPHQFGTEDQGWIAHFLIRALAGKPITIYGDGKQIRDVLFIDDLVDAFLLAQQNMDRVSGQAFNIGGGPSRTLSLLELIRLIESIHGREPSVQFGPWRVGDQRYYVSDTRKFRQATGWAPKVDVRQGVTRLYHWLRDSLEHPETELPTFQGSDDYEILAR
jgi:CDP-paratose 2-epimerase